MSVPADSTLDDARRFQTFQIVELLIDLIYGDVVIGDQVCRRVADALITQYEDAIRWLVTQEPSLPLDVQSALNAYCARHVLYAAPELLIVSREAHAAYAQIAEVLRGEDTFAAIGAAMSEALNALSVRLETRPFARLLDLFGEAVIAYMTRAAQAQHSVKSTVPMTFMECVVRFGTSATRELRTPSGSRSGAKRERAGGDKEEVEKQKEKEEESELTPREEFPRALRLAMTSPSPKRHEVKPRQRNRSEQREEKQKSVPRVVRQTDDSILSAVENMHSAAGREVSSIIVADDSDIQNVPTSRPGLRTVGEVCVSSATDTSLLGTNVHERSYFLCRTTNRYEPMEVKGFYA